MGRRDPRREEFLEAVHRGETARVVEFLRSGVDANDHEPGWSTALLMASRNGDVATMRVLLDHGAHPNPDGSRNDTALTHAIRWSLRQRLGEGGEPDRGPLELLLAAGAKPHLIDAVLADDRGMVAAFLDAGGGPNEGEGSYSGPLLMEAAGYGYVEMVGLLLDRGAEIDAVDDLGRTALMQAARYGQIAVVARLLDRGAEINAGHRSWSRNTALSEAEREGHSEMVEYLLGRGARWTFMDAFNRGDVALFMALLDEKILADRERDGPEAERADDPDRPARVDHVTGQSDRIAMEAVKRGDSQVVRLLLDRGAAHLLDWRDHHSLLAEACRHGHAEVARLLIDHGADLHAIGTDEMTPLAWARKEGQAEIVGLLVQAGAVR